MKVDLHCHSYYSDGKHSPAFLISRAIANDLTHLAITDHDCTTAFGTTAEIDQRIELISGVEISCNWQGKEIHIVGLCIDPLQPQLVRLMTQQQSSRHTRMLQMDEKLQALGTSGLAEYCGSLPSQSYTRNHVANFLVEQGISKNHQKAFKNFLGKRGRIYVDYNWCNMEEAINTIHIAKGLAVLAHPGRYPLGKRQLEALLDDFASAQGDALEVSYGNIDLPTKVKLCELANSRQLYYSVGSDFHDDDAHWTDLGKFPPLDAIAKKNAIWEHPGWHSW